MRQRHQHSAYQVYCDIVMLMLAVIIVMLSVMLVVANFTPKQHQDGVPPFARYLVTLSWPDNRNVDLDLWLQDPFGHVIYYGAREARNISLDRDSRGFDTNKQVNPDGSAFYAPNREVISIRAIIPGDYIVAVGYFGGVDEKTGQGYSFNPPDPRAAIDAVLEVDKVNPVVTEVAGQKIHLVRIKESHNYIRFRVDQDGKVTVLPTPVGSIVSEHTQ